ncbi:MAG TPA: hypothetical protein DC049_05170, partial [Spirochaetia bacterium]|nr:hypothetical protein [Spirochaetia bacterium]
MKNITAWLCTAVFLLTSCVSQKPIRKLSEVSDAFLGLQINEIDRLIEATTVENRDIKSLSVYYLCAFITHLQTKKITKQFTAEKKAAEIEKITHHLEKVFSLQKDFNIRCLCLHGISLAPSESGFDLISTALEDSDNTVRDSALISLKKFLVNEKYRTEPVKNRLLAMLKTAQPPLLYRVIDNLACF